MCLRRDTSPMTKATGRIRRGGEEGRVRIGLHQEIRVSPVLHAPPKTEYVCPPGEPLQGGGHAWTHSKAACVVARNSSAYWCAYTGMPQEAEGGADLYRDYKLSGGSGR